jgi:hypothetical protein
LSLKESRMKGNVGPKVFEKFCERKGLDRQKEFWERKTDEELKMKEIELKDFQTRNKTSKSKKKKLELLKECKEKLFSSIEDWKETPDMEEERRYKNLKESVTKERMMEMLGKKGKERQTEECPEMKKMKENLRKTTPRKIARKKMPGRVHGGSSPVAKNFVRQVGLRQNLNVKQMAELIETSQQINLTTAEVCGEKQKRKFTKPQLVYSRIGVQISNEPQCTGPTDQWGERRGIRLGSRQPPGQSDDRNEQNHEQKLQNGQKRKFEPTQPAPSNL